MNITELMEKIELQDEVRTRVLAYVAAYDKEKYDKLILELIDPKTSESGYEKIKSELENNDDDYNTGMLAINLLGALKSYDRYVELGISDRIFIDTMKCFTRFLNEALSMHGMYKFDRSWWTYRQLNMTLFRIGELEYEYTEKYISLHIPSDAKFTPEIIDESMAEAREFTKKYFPAHLEKDTRCGSWLLSPVLKPMLKETSNILKFQQRFEIRSFNPEPRGFVQWIFGAKQNTDPHLLKEETSLQRSVKKLLLEGKSVGSADGILIK